MAHRAQQIVEAVAAALTANADLRAQVEFNRVRSLSEVDAELDALTVNYGADTPEEADLESFRSSLEVVLTFYCTGATEREVLEKLLELRRQSHISMMADFTFGLAFVWHTAYAGADAPALQMADRIIGSLTSRWLARYLMNISDPE